MSSTLAAYQAQGLCLPHSDNCGDETVQYKHKGFMDVTVIRSRNIAGLQEEIVPTSEYLPPAAKMDKDRKALRKFDQYSVLVRRIFSRRARSDVLTSTELCIQSPALCSIFRHIVVDTYTSIDISSTPIVLPAPFYELFFKRKEIEEYVSDKQHTAADRAEVKLLHDFFRDDGLTIENMKRYEAMVSQGEIDHQTLWTIFPPNELLFLNLGSAPECWICRDVKPLEQSKWQVTGSRVSFNGSKLGLTQNLLSISFGEKVDGKMSISDLPIIPKKYFNRSKAVSTDIIRRGYAFKDIMGVDLDGHVYRHYDGPKWVEDIAGRLVDGMMRERVVVDYKSYRETNSDGVQKMEDLGPDSSQADGFSALLTKIPQHRGIRTMDDLLLISPPRVPAYGLKSKQWSWVLIDNLTPLTPCDAAFNSLQVKPEVKSLVRSLVTGHQNGVTKDDFDDVIITKGRGLAIMLYGKPGIGKTLTAESIAELRGVPLYSLSGGELGVDVKEVEQRLGMLFALGRRWKAVILLDEADVVMTKRSNNELERNAIVAVWLRMLEYFEGIIFLTTNRRNDLDEAFQSRIHLSVELPDLGPTQRAAIWEGLVKFNRKVIDAELWTPAIFEALSGLDVNGRVIKNLLRTATYHARATNAAGLLAPSHVRDVVVVERSSDENIEEVVAKLNALIGNC